MSGPFHIALVAVMTATSSPYLDYDPNALPFPRKTPADDLCQVVKLPDLDCFQTNTCTTLDRELAITSICYRRNWKTAKEDLRLCRAEKAVLQTFSQIGSTTSSPSGSWTPWEVVGISVIVAVVAAGVTAGVMHLTK